MRKCPGCGYDGESWNMEFRAENSATVVLDENLRTISIDDITEQSVSDESYNCPSCGMWLGDVDNWRDLNELGEAWEHEDED